MVAEYCDTTHALRTVQRLNGKQISSPQGEVALYLELHTPDILQITQRLGNLNTPTRCSVEQSNIADSYARLSLKAASSFPGQPEALASVVPSPSTNPYMTSNGDVYGLPTGPMPLIMGSMYGAPVAFHNGYPAGMQLQAHTGANLNTFPPTGYGHSTALVPYGYDGSHQFGFHPQNYEPAYGYPNPLAHQRGSYMDRPSGRRQTALKVNNQNHRRGTVPYHDQHHDQASGQHNQVDIHRIKQGIDVRTTVSIFLLNHLE